MPAASPPPLPQPLTQLPHIADTVYLPALRKVQHDLHTTASLTASSVAIYM